jgi:hypothetical protein
MYIIRLPKSITGFEKKLHVETGLSASLMPIRTSFMHLQYSEEYGDLFPPLGLPGHSRFQCYRYPLCGLYAKYPVSVCRGLSTYVRKELCLAVKPYTLIINVFISPLFVNKGCIRDGVTTVPWVTAFSSLCPRLPFRQRPFYVSEIYQGIYL